MSTSPTHFTTNGSIQTYRVPQSGRYVIVAAGAQGGSGGGPGGKGARVCGTFSLLAGDILQIVVGQQGSAGTTPQQPAGGGGGGSFVWKGSDNRLHPDAGGGGGGGSFVWKCDSTRRFSVQPLLAAGGGGGGSGSDGAITMDGIPGAASGGRNGHGGSADWGDHHYSGGGGAGWLSAGAQGSAPTFCAGGSHWGGGVGASYQGHHGGNGGFGGGGGGAFIGCGSGGGGGYSGGGGGTQNGPGGGGGGSYNEGEKQLNLPGIQTGDGAVMLWIEVPHEFARGLQGNLLDPLAATPVSAETGVASRPGADAGARRHPQPGSAIGILPSLRLWNVACLRMAKRNCP